MGKKIQPPGGCFALLFSFALIACFAATAHAGRMKEYDSKYYAVQSDMPPEIVREQILRMNYIADEFDRRLKGLNGVFNHKFKFHLFQDVAGFQAANGPRGSYDACFMASDGTNRLMVVLRATPLEMIHPMQHEAFVQFCQEALTNGKQSLPIWVEEGVAEYFGQSVYTGDGFTCGLIPPNMLKWVQGGIDRTNVFRSIDAQLNRDRREFYANGNSHDFAQMWSFVHYLIHGDGGRHRAAFEKYLHDTSRSVTHAEAWQKAFGESGDLEAAWKKWWLAQKPEVVKDGYAQAAAAALCSYLGRATQQKQNFNTASELLQAAQTNKIKIPDEDWLPPPLAASISDWMTQAGADTKFAIGPNRAKPQIIATLASGTRIVATYNPLLKDHRTSVEVNGKSVDLPVADTTAKAGGQGAIALKSARFGAEGRWIDVTDKCKNIIAGDLLSVQSKLKEVLGIDPNPGEIANLELTLIINGAEFRLTLTDNTKMNPLQLTTQIPADQR